MLADHADGATEMRLKCMA